MKGVYIQRRYSPELKQLITECELKISTLIQVPIYIDITVSEGIITTRLLQNKIEEYFEIGWYKVEGKSKYTRITTARQVYCYLCRKYTKKTLKAIGKDINKGYTSVLHASNNIESLLFLKDEYVMSFLTPIINDLNQMKNESEEVSN